jgi:hypothetical protein
MEKLAFDEDRDLALAQPSNFVKIATAFSLVGALLGGTGALQLSFALSRTYEPPAWAAVSIYGNIFLAPFIAFAAMKLFRLAPWAPITLVVVNALATVLGCGELAFVLLARAFFCVSLLGPCALWLGTLASVLAIRSARASIAARQRLSDEGIELGV